MKLAWFGVEEWLNPMDSLARINLGSSCVSALRMDELFDLTGEDLGYLIGRRGDTVYRGEIGPREVDAFPAGRWEPLCTILDVQPEEPLTPEELTRRIDMMFQDYIRGVALRLKAPAAVYA